MSKNISDAKEKLLRAGIKELTEIEKSVLNAIERRSHISRNINKELDDTRTFGERVADGVASFGGSWTFIGIFFAIMMAWVVLNTLILSGGFDPYPYILLNLFLSMLASLQAPIIMMSQNRQAARDRMDAAHDYEVNLKAELEIRTLHEKIDMLREIQWEDLVKMQQQQIQLLEDIVHDKAQRR